MTETYRVHQLALPLDAGPEELSRAAARALKVETRRVLRVVVERKSVDARDKGRLRLVYGLLVEVEGGAKPRVPPSVALRAAPLPPYRGPTRTRDFPVRPVVVGAGPAGLFAALLLAEAGARPLLLERGDPVEKREAVVAAFLAGGALDPESNVQFGEGGAGTYSDGKLTTQVKDEGGRNRKVLAELVAAGAPEEILYLAKPHVGTDRLVTVVSALRRRIEGLGGEVRFRSRVDAILEAGGRVSGVVVNGSERIETDAVVLAPGHSARDIFATLAASGIAMERKSFAIGLRIEHPQEMISRSQFGEEWRHPALPAADYKLTGRTSDGRGVYSFCMCPGGRVVNSSSETGGVVCNGMSDFARDGRNANAAIVVAVSPEDFSSSDVLAGVRFQREWEAAAFAAAGGSYALPVQTYGDFREGRVTTAFGSVLPSVSDSGRFAFADLNRCLPPTVARGIVEGVGRFGSSIEGFDRPDAVLTGVETRTSSPVRILRNAIGEASLPGLYPAGEGAGYAGGIMSAAMDGLRVAEWVLTAGVG